jgi:hypothetical protein
MSTSLQERQTFIAAPSVSTPKEGPQPPCSGSKSTVPSEVGEAHPRAQMEHNNKTAQTEETKEHDPPTRVKTATRGQHQRPPPEAHHAGRKTLGTYDGAFKKEKTQEHPRRLVQRTDQRLSPGTQEQRHTYLRQRLKGGPRHPKMSPLPAPTAVEQGFHLGIVDIVYTESPTQGSW